MPNKITKHHLLITGTGRTGTTFLVKLLTMLDVDTGFTKDFIPIHPEARAGLEFQGLGGDLPYVLKNPKFMWQLSELLRETPVVIDHILIPIRDIQAASKSRRKNLEKASDYDNPQKVIGGLEGVVNPDEQEAFFLEKFYKFFEFVSTYNLPLTTLQYPRLVLDAEYLYHKIGSLFSGISKERFINVFNEVADLSLVNRYTKNDGYRLIYDDSENIKQFYSVENTVSADILQLRPELQQLRTNFLLKEKKERQLQRQIDRKDRAIAEKDAEITQKDAEIARTKRYREELYSVYTSRSWRYTKPLRKAGQLAKQILALLHKQFIRMVIKRVYFMLPAFIRNSRLMEKLKNLFKSKESTL